jgi:hypothetical protein
MKISINPKWLKETSVKEIRELFKSDKQRMDLVLKAKKAMK